VSGVPELGSPFDFALLHRAWLDCRRGKGNARARWAFEYNLERNLVDLSEALKSRRYQPAPSVCFVSNQPKRREIFAAAFRDRVIHHLLVAQIAPYWERRFIHDSYACRPGKGTLAAVDRVQQFIRQASCNGTRTAWYLHLDVRSFFLRIDKQILLRIVVDGLRKQGLVWREDLACLAQVIIQSDPTRDVIRRGRGFDAVPAHKSLFHTGNLTGLPIGNYTSQFLANVYLDGLDQFVKHTLKIHGYVRYVDDLLLIDTDQARLLDAEQRIGEFLQRELKLELNPGARRLGRVSNGIDALGYIVYCHHRYLRRRTVRRFRRLLGEFERQTLTRTAQGTRIQPQTGQAERMLSVCASYAGMMRHADCRRLAQRLQQRYAWIGLLWRRDQRGRLLRRFVAGDAHPSLAAQWWALRRLWPRARLLLQVGCYWEAYGMDARWLAHVLGLRLARPRRGLPLRVGFPYRARAMLKRVRDAADRPLLLFRQSGGRQGAVAARTLAVMWVPAGGMDGAAA
jgi:hypothetical protein